jgi:hypothetical protein
LGSRFISQPALFKNETKGIKLNINLFKKKNKKQKTFQPGDHCEVRIPDQGKGCEKENLCCFLKKKKKG